MNPPNRREFAVLAGAAAIAASMPEGRAAAADPASVTPFHVSVPDDQLQNLRDRLAAARWPRSVATD